MRRLAFTLETSRLSSGEISWTSLADVWIAVTFRRGDSRLRAGADEQIVSHEVHMRYRKDVRPGLRLRRGTRVLTIHSVEDADNRQHHLICLCEEHILSHRPQKEGT